MALECKVIDILPQGTHDLFLAEVVAVDVDDAILDENGQLGMDRAGLAAYAHGEYFALGDKIGTFGFSAAKKGKGTPSVTKVDTARSAPKPKEKPGKPAEQNIGKPVQKKAVKKRTASRK